MDLATLVSERTPLRLHSIVCCFTPRTTGTPCSFNWVKAFFVVSANHVAWSSSVYLDFMAFRSSTVPPTTMMACCSRPGYCSRLNSFSRLSLNWLLGCTYIRSQFPLEGRSVFLMG